jgi:hypothetical protein
MQLFPDVKFVQPPKFATEITKFTFSGKIDNSDSAGFLSRTHLGHLMQSLSHSLRARSLIKRCSNFPQPSFPAAAAAAVAQISIERMRAEGKGHRARDSFSRAPSLSFFKKLNTFPLSLSLSPRAPRTLRRSVKLSEREYIFYVGGVCIVRE